MGFWNKFFGSNSASMAEPTDKIKVKFLTAARSGDNSTVENLLNRHPTLANAKDKELMSALHYAAGLGHTLVVKALLKANAPINATNWDGWTPLHFAASCGKDEIVELLLSNGADPSAMANEGVTPAKAAAVEGHKRIESILISKGGNKGEEANSFLMKAIEAMKNNKAEEGLKLLLEAIQINPKLAKAHQLLAMHYMGVQNGASARKHFEILKSLDQNLTKELLDTPFGPLFERGAEFIVS